MTSLNLKCFYPYLILCFSMVTLSFLFADENQLDTSSEVVVQDNQNENLDLIHAEKLPDTISSTTDQPEEIIKGEEIQESAQESRRINKIIITGNQFTPKEAIVSYIPYQVGEIFSPLKTGQLIRNLYHGLKRFRNITVKGENVDPDLINLHVIVEEKKILKDIIFKGNKAISEKEIKKKVDVAEIPAIDEEELKILAQKIKQLYLEKGYNQTSIDTELYIDDDDKAIAIFTIHEGVKSLVKRIMFTGNHSISAKELRNILFTREDWILSLLDKSGTFHPERLEADKHMLEQFYQNKGFVQAKVTDVLVDVNSNTQNINLTFEIEEGPQYRISEVHAPGNEILPEEIILAQLPVQPGQLYSRERITNAMKVLEMLWGNQGYIFAHIEPSIEPDEDTKTVRISFVSDLGHKVYLNRINIKGNKKTRDKVIRRRIALNEGELITNVQMEMSKHGIESLGYFEERDGVNWKINRLNKELADLDLIVHERKTGHGGFELGYGGTGFDLSSPASGIKVKGSLSDTNLFGSGTHLNIETSWAKEELNFLFHLAQPWLFDRPISSAIDIYHRRPTYDELRNIVPSSVNEKLTGGALTGGFIVQSNAPIFHDTQFLGSFGIDSIRFQTIPKANLVNPPPNKASLATEEYQCILDREFANGDFVWLAGTVEQNLVNHPIHPSRGHKWKFTSKVAVPSLNGNTGFFKVNVDAHWFTPLIDEFSLILHLHGFLGLVTPINDFNIPFSERYNIGGAGSVRGYNFGQLSPKFLGDTIGSKKALFINVELIFPITPDFNMKGVAFYDGGAGWDSPHTSNTAACEFITGNNFDYRHSVGFGIRVLRPTPVKIDWGFKIDPRKNESASEVHFGMSYDW